MKPIQITVGGAGLYDPAAGSTDCVIPITKGQTIYVEKVGFGTYPYNKYVILSDGGFRLTDTTFSINESFFIHVTGVAYGTDATAYTNGFNYSQVMAALFGRVGWKQAGSNPVLNATNLLSKSGRCFNDGSFHSLVTLQNLKGVMEEVNVDDTAFNSFIETLQRSIIIRSLNGVFNVPENIYQGLLYDRWGYNDTTITNEGNFVGVRLRLPPDNKLAVQIDSVALYFDADVTFNLYLFSDLKKAPVWFDEVVAQANTQVIATLPDLVLNHIGGNNHGGLFYLGYFQDDLNGAKALRENDVRFACDQPFRAEFMQAKKLVSETDFDRRQVECTNVTFGLNPHLSVFRDHTWQITHKAALFDNLIGLQMAAQMIEQIMYNTRSNSTERILKEGASSIQASLDLQGVAPISDGPKTTGLRQQITKELDRVRKEFYPRPHSKTVSVC